MREMNGSSMAQRYVTTYEDLIGKVDALRKLGYTIGLTSGTWDLMHIGHNRYIETLKKKVDIVIIGVDGDEKVKQRKGPHRPVVPEDERVEMLCHIRHVDLVFVKRAENEHLKLVKIVQPDVLLVSQRTDRPQEEVDKLESECGELMILESQATTSTTARVRRLHVDGIAEFKRRIDEIFCKFMGKEDE